MGLSRIVFRNFSKSERRQLATRIIRGTLGTLETTNDAVELLIRRDKTETSLVIPLVWLRDHCRSPSSFNAATNQRKSNAVDLLQKATVDNMENIIVNAESELTIRWNDGLVTKFCADEFLCTSQIDQRPNVGGYVKLWKKLANEDLPRMDVSSFTMKLFAECFVKYGMVLVDGVKANPKATEAFCRSIAPIHDTLFGAFWVFSNKTQEKGEEYHEDTAYGSEEIGLHTDGTYFNQAPGIQVFHCLHPAEEGGDTVLADGVQCALDLKQRDPEAFHILSNRKIEHHYVESGTSSDALHSTSRDKSVIELDSHGNIIQIRFNPYDRAPFRVLKEGPDSAEYARRALAYYRAYTMFSSICHAPENATRIALRPGTIIFLDNFRILHSRTSFKGWRQMCGCYLSRDNFMARTRPLLPTEIRRFI